tara:strand:+ start:5861 stop:6088 length:228 start_codon:yes stop_codon:yes gene_type:complete
MQWPAFRVIAAEMPFGGLYAYEGNLACFNQFPSLNRWRLMFDKAAWSIASLLAATLQAGHSERSYSADCFSTILQ